MVVVGGTAEQVVWGDRGEGVGLWEVGGFFNYRSDAKSQTPKHTNKIRP